MCEKSYLKRHRRCGQPIHYWAEGYYSTAILWQIKMRIDICHNGTVIAFTIEMNHVNGTHERKVYLRFD